MKEKWPIPAGLVATQHPSFPFNAQRFPGRSFLAAKNT
jgi:hypothetical protein